MQNLKTAKNLALTLTISIIAAACRLGSGIAVIPKDADRLQDLAYVVDAQGARGTAVESGQKREASAGSLGDLWGKLGLTGPSSPPLPCVLPDSIPDVRAPLETPPGKGTLPRPWPDDRNYPGSAGGGCGTFAALMCSDILDGQSRPVTPERWRRAHEGIGESPQGGSNQEKADEYHRKQIDGCSRSERLKPGDIDVINRLKARHCDCKIAMIGPNSGHIEVITGVTTNAAGQKCLETNSWGKTALVCGNDQANGDQFSHSEDKPGGNFGTNSPHWPAGQTRARWSCVCPRGNCTP